MSRTLGITITLVWLACMAALFQRDILPYCQAQDPPAQLVPDGDYQVAIFNGSNQRVGTTWVTTIRLKESTTIHSLTQLDVRQVSSMLPFSGHLYLTTDLTYSPKGELNEFVFVLDSSAVQGRIQGVRYDREFACKATAGPITQTLVLDAEISKCLGDSLRPFTHLEGLHVGQSWQLRIIDPFSMISGGAAEFSKKLVKVTAREPIEHENRTVECFKIESDDIVAWANDSGRILRQEVKIPLLGKWTMTDEPFDELEKRRANAERQTLSNQRSQQRESSEAIQAKD